MIHKQPSPIRGHIQVTFELPASIWADHIYLVGEFNDWDPRATPFHCTRSGIWRVTLDLPAGKRYEFRYLIDEHWCTDQHADGCVQGAWETANSYVDAVLPLETPVDRMGHGMVHESHPHLRPEKQEVEMEGAHTHPRTPPNGRARKHALSATPSTTTPAPVPH